jgi:exopolyphosphatase/guanosine-5'-triphosphate,3'-diphosphate pyrophosphatase
MMKEIRFGAIDIGSNAARLLITSVTGLEEGEEVYFKKAALVRVPLRLGFDAFVNGELSPRSIDRLTHTMQAYFHTMKAYEVSEYRACATSAMREARNSDEIIKKVKKASNLDIEVLPGHSEARIIYNTQVTEKLDENRPYIYIDVGGGSTEVSIFKKKEVIASKSFKIGTIRLLNGLVTIDKWIEMQDWVTLNSESMENLAGIGTGGNISKIFKIIKKPKNTPLFSSEIEGLYRELEPLSLEQRIRLYDMKTDRADVIVPAANIFRNVMSWANCEEIYVPKKGLADGITRMLFDEYMGK